MNLVNIILALVAAKLIIYIYGRFKGGHIEEKDFWTIAIILFVSIVGIIQIEIKYADIIKIKESVERVAKINVKNIAYTVGGMGRFGGGKYKLESEKKIRNESYILLRELGVEKEEIQSILSDLDYWIAFDEKQSLKKPENK